MKIDCQHDQTYKYYTHGFDIFGSAHRISLNVVDTSLKSNYYFEDGTGYTHA